MKRADHNDALNELLLKLITAFLKDTYGFSGDGCPLRRKTFNRS